MIEKTLRRYLEHALPDPVFLEKLPGAPERSYILEKTGGDVADHIWSAVIAVQSCAPSLLEAAEMSSAAVAAMLAAPAKAVHMEPMNAKLEPRNTGLELLVKSR